MNDISNIKFPDKFITSASLARMVVDEAVDSHDSLWEAIDAVEDHMAGEPLLDDAELEEAGLGWVQNRNYGKMRANVESATQKNASQIYLAFDSLSIQFKNNEDLPLLNNPRLREVASTIIANALMESLEFDSRFYTMINSIERCSYTFGFCSVTRTPHDWLGEWHHPRNIAFEPNSTPEDIRTWITFDEVKADTLYREYVNVKNQASKATVDGDNQTIHVKSNWIIEGLEEVLYHAYASNTQEGAEVPEDWENVLKSFHDNAQDVMANTSDVKVAKIFRREFDGTFTETYIAYANTFNTRATSNGSAIGGKFSPEYLLYSRNHGKFDQDDLISIIRDSGFTANGYISELRGISKFAYEDSLSFDKLKNDLVNKLILSQPTYERTSSQATKQFQLGVFSGYNIGPKGFALSPNQFSANFAPHLQLLAIDETGYKRETEHFSPTVTGKLSSRPTTQEVQAKSAEATASKRGRSMIRNIDYSHMALRMIHSLIEFKSKLKNGPKRSLEYFYQTIENDLKLYPQIEDVDIEVLLKSVVKVTIQPVLEDIDAIERSLLIAESSNARNKLRRMLLKAYGYTRSQVNDLLPPLDAVEREMSDQRVAAMENADMDSTREIVFFKSDDHQVHLDMHFSKLARVLDGLSQGGDPEEAFNFSVNCLSHTAKHVEAMFGSPFFSGMSKRYVELQRNFNREVLKLKRIVEQLAEQRQQQQQPESTPEMEKAKADIEIKWFQAADKIKRQDALQQERARQMQSAQEFKQGLAKESSDQKIQTQRELASIKKDLALVTASLNLAK